MTDITMIFTQSDTCYVETNLHNVNLTGYNGNLHLTQTVQIYNKMYKCPLKIPFSNNTRSKNDHQIRNLSLVAHTDPSCIDKCSINTFDITLGNVLFNDALNTFYLWLYGIRHGKGPLSKRGNPLPPHELLFPISSKCSFICIIPQTG